MSCHMQYRYEYRDGLVVEGETEDRHSAQECLEQCAAVLKKRGIPYTVDGLTITHDNVQGATEDLHFTVTFTWTDRPEEAR